MSTVHIVVSADGVATVDLDGAPYSDGCPKYRADLQRLIDEITADAGTAVRVEIQEADGTTYVDVAMPRDPTSANRVAGTATTTAALGPVASHGFEPGEQVALAYVISRHTADATGHATLNLPPALIAACHPGLVLLGLTSKNVAPIEATA